MMKNESLQQIERLVGKYEDLTPVQRRDYNESMTCKDFILPLFQALGWDVYNVANYEVSSESQVSGKRVDYAFHLKNLTKFFLEAKKINVDLREERWAEQAVMYAYHKSVPWAVLTDFESLKVFNAEWDEPDIERSIIFEIPYKNYLSDERLWLLSKQSMEVGGLDKYAEENFKKPKREPVDKQLAADLVSWRKILFDNLKGYNENKSLTDKKIGEAVQRILDRLIFIRTTEDKGIENKYLQELERNYRENKKGFSLSEELKKLFKNYDEWYNSKLFEVPHICDTLELEYVDNFLADIIKELYKNKKGIRYDFVSINADVLGSIYEQYLGQIQKEDGKEKKSSKRKSQGIYYTPRYIVDYIVQNTLGEVLKNKLAHEAQRIKILDPACGSGSFLIKAFEVLDNHIMRERNQKGTDAAINYARKFDILTSNIYGVDLDPEAVEIAQLNLLLKTLEGRERLPNLNNNIECGNSLISGTEDELKKYFGKNWKDKKPFNWEERFEDVFKQGGFDVVMGNPPYIRPHKLDNQFKNYSWSRYEVFKAKSDIYAIFMQKAIELSKEGGISSFIVSSTWLTLESFNFLRKYILDNCLIQSLIILPSKVFESATVETMIFKFKKEKSKKERNNNMISIAKFDGSNFIEINKIKQSHYLTTHLNIFDLSYNLSNQKLSSKIESGSKPLKNFVEFYYGLKTGDDDKFILNKKISNEYKMLLFRSDFSRYRISFDNQYIWYTPDLMRKNKKTARPGEKERFEKPKIIIQDINKKLIATYDDENYYLKDALMLHAKENINLKYILIIINSKLLNYWYTQQFKTLSVAKNAFLILPIKNINLFNLREKKYHDELVKLADKMLKLNKKLQNLDPILDENEYKELKSEIDKTDKEIDEKVYELYGLTEAEIKIVEKN